MKILYHEDGRLGRKRFFVIFVLVSLLGSLLVFIAQQVPNDIVRNLFTILVFLFYGLAIRSIMVKRCHDFGQTIWSKFCRDQVPIIGPLLATFDLFFKPGDKNRNEYGDPSS